MRPVIKIKRVYEPHTSADGYRVLADRLWPRGIAKKDAHIDEWAKELAPSTVLRLWYGHTPELWSEFKRKYLAELKNNDAVAGCKEAWEDKKVITLIYAAKDTEHTHALVLQQYLQQLYQ